MINHRFHVDNEKGDSGIGYYMIICRDLVVQLGLTAYFKRHVFQWYGVTVNMKEPGIFLGKLDLTKQDMCDVVIQTAKPDSAL